MIYLTIDHGPQDKWFITSLTEFFAATEVLLSEQQQRRQRRQASYAAGELSLPEPQGILSCMFEEGLVRYLLGAPTRVLRTGNRSSLVRWELQKEND